MSLLSNVSPLLRRALLADAAVSGAMGLVGSIFAGSLANLFGLSEALLRYSGLSLLPFAGLLIYLATREQLPRSAVWAVIVYNILWAADSILILLLGWVQPTSLGYGFVIAQAIGVIGFAELEYFGLRRSGERTLA